MPVIYSTLSAPTKYAVYKPGSKDISVVDEEKSTLIDSRANVANDKLITVAGHKTEVTQAQLELLLKNKVFQKHQKNGYITIRNDDVAVEKVIEKEMEAREPSAPITPEFYEKRKKGKDKSFKKRKGATPVLNIDDSTSDE